MEWQGLRKSARVVWLMFECGNDRVYVRKGLIMMVYVNKKPGVAELM